MNWTAWNSVVGQGRHSRQFADAPGRATLVGRRRVANCLLEVASAGADLANGRLLCPRHHRLDDDPRYAMTVHADNQVTYARRM